MKNIDKIREMTPKELAELIEKHPCDVCAFQLYENCDDMDCEEGIIAWLELDAKEILTIESIISEFEKFCVGECAYCSYRKADNCKASWIINNFNIVDGKISRREIGNEF